MERSIFRFSVMVVMVLGLFLPGAARAASASPVPAASTLAGSTLASPAVEAGGASPAGFLNADGTLKLDGSFSGALNLSGYSVRIDPERGPVFGPPSSKPAAPKATATPGNWADLGGGGGALNDYVFAVAYMGSNVIVGGYFLDAGNDTTADYVAKWDGSNWSGLGNNGWNSGPLESGAVFALAVSGTDLYVGGNFYYVYDSTTYIPEARYIAKWNSLTGHWSALGSDGSGGPSLNYMVSAIAVSGSDVYVGGNFTDVHDAADGILTAADYIAKWNGSKWSALGSNGSSDGSLNAQVSAIAVSGSNVYVGGNFTDVHDATDGVLTAADYLAKWNGSKWSAVGHGSLPTDPSLGDRVYALAVSGSYLYVGGNFTSVNDGGTPMPQAAFLARWDTAGLSWSSLGSDGSGGPSLNNSVFSIAVSGSDVYIGGIFIDLHDAVNGTLNAADYVAKWDGSSWSALGSNGAGDGAVGNDVRGVAASGTDVYVGGAFVGINNGGAPLSSATYLGKWNGSGWAAVGDPQGPLSGDVYAMAVSGTNVYVGGYFQNVVDHGVTIPEADNIARWDGSHWHALGSDGSGNGAVPGEVHAIAVSGSDVYVGGWFSAVHDGSTYLDTADYIAKWNGSHWSALGSDGLGNGSLNNGVVAIAVSGSNVYVGGYFTDVHDATDGILTAADYVAKWNGSKWSALGSNGSGDGSLGYGSAVCALALMGTDLYVGGYFTDVHDATDGILTAADYIAKWNGSKWSAVGHGTTSTDPSLNWIVYALAVSGPNLYVGGDFTNVQNGATTLDAADYVARWDGTNWSALGSDGLGGGSLNSTVYALAVSGTDVYVGGMFTDVHDAVDGTLDAADYVAKWNGLKWSALGNDGGTGGSLNSPPNPPGVDIMALAVGPTDVYVGGRFFNVNNKGTPLPYADHVAAYGVLTISGNAGIGGATLNFTGGSTTADSTGNYFIGIPNGWSGTVTPSKTNYTFSPGSKVYSGVASPQTGQDYSATYLLPPPLGAVYPLDSSEACLRPQVGVELMLSDAMRKGGSFDPSTVMLTLDGIDVTGLAAALQTETYPASIGSVLYTPPADLALGAHQAVLTYPSGGGTATWTWNFTVAVIVCPTGGAHSPTLESGPPSAATDVPDSDSTGIQAP
jgi:hypothetical protein